MRKAIDILWSMTMHFLTMRSPSRSTLSCTLRHWYSGVTLSSKPTLVSLRVNPVQVGPLQIKDSVLKQNNYSRLFNTLTVIKTPTAKQSPITNLNGSVYKFLHYENWEANSECPFCFHLLNQNKLLFNLQQPPDTYQLFLPHIECQMLFILTTYHIV